MQSGRISSRRRNPSQPHRGHTGGRMPPRGKDLWIKLWRTVPGTGDGTTFPVKALFASARRPANSLVRAPELLEERL